MIRVRIRHNSSQICEELCLHTWNFFLEVTFCSKMFLKISFSTRDAPTPTIEISACQFRPPGLRGLFVWYFYYIYIGTGTFKRITLFQRSTFYAFEGGTRDHVQIRLAVVIFEYVCGLCRGLSLGPHNVTMVCALRHRQSASS